MKSRSTRRLLLRPLGRIAERWPPWFYERRFLRTQAIARLSLVALRHLSGAGRLPPTIRTDRGDIRRFEDQRAETVVVGGLEHPPVGAVVIDIARGDVALGVYPGRVLGVLRRDRLIAFHFDELILATGTYDRLPPIPGNDLPGVIGLQAAERYAACGGLRPGTRMAAWTPSSRRSDIEALAAAHGLEIVWMSDSAPRALSGRGRVQRLHSDVTVACDVFVTAVSQPAIELALQAGARAELTRKELPILAVGDSPDWVALRGAVATKSSGVPDVPAADAAFACLCEDVRIGDIRACVAEGFEHAELVKRRTGAMTGPCQGKLCSAIVLAVLRDEGIDAGPTSMRPPALPVPLGRLASDA